MLRRAVLVTLALGLSLAAGAGLVFSQGAPVKVAMLLPGSINDQSWNAAGFAGLTKLKTMGIEIAYSENVQAADHIEAMKDYARRGFSPIIGHSGRFLSAAQRVGPEFDKTIFLVGSGSGGSANVISVDIANEQFGYLAGVLAARMSKTGKVGAIAGLEGLPNMIASVGGFRLGVKSVRPDAEVKVIYLQSMEDPAAAKEAAYALIGGGADVIGGKLNAGHAGIIQAAKDKGAYTIGRSVGHTAIAPERVLTNIDEKWSDVYVAAVTELRAGKLVGNYVAYGYNTPATNGADLRYSPERALNLRKRESHGDTTTQSRCGRSGRARDRRAQAQAWSARGVRECATRWYGGPRKVRAGIFCQDWIEGRPHRSGAPRSRVLCVDWPARRTDHPRNAGREPLRAHRAPWRSAGAQARGAGRAGRQARVV